MVLTPDSQAAIEILRVWPADFKWYLIPIFALVIYIYFVEIEKGNWNRVFAGLAFWGMDWINEIINALILVITQESALWTCAGETGFLIFIGLNIEISLMFAMAGIAFAKVLPEDKNLKIFGKIPNRWALAIGNALFCVIVELVLNYAGALQWHYSFWNNPLFGIQYILSWIPIVIFGYLHFMVVSFWVHDMKSRKNQILSLIVIYSIVIVAVVLFGVILQLQYF
ncbi:MAG: hypothetical protein ACXAC8_04020 [Candidatus Hodarchaeales archaeon]